MERTTRPALENIGAGGIELRVQTTECIVDRGCTEHTHTFTFSLLYLKPLGLDDDAQTLDEENATKQRQQQFLVNDDSTDTDDAADSQRTGIAHEDLGGIGVIPQETNHGTDEGGQEHHQLLRTGNVHDVEIGRIDNMRRYIGKDG